MYFFYNSHQKSFMATQSNNSGGQTTLGAPENHCWRIDHYFNIISILLCKINEHLMCNDHIFQAGPVQVFMGILTQDLIWDPLYYHFYTPLCVLHIHYH